MISLFGAFVKPFQFTPLREGRLARQNVGDCIRVFQFTPLREGRRDDGKQIAVVDISIHAPPRGATAHAAQALARQTFQFTPLREGRRGTRRTSPGTADISIHAPPRGATTRRAHGCWRRFISIHAPPRGATVEFSLILRLNRISIHAPPRGATPTRRAAAARRHFNSRPSARGDVKRYAISANLLFNPYKSAWLNNSATQFVEIILVIFHRIIV